MTKLEQWMNRPATHTDFWLGWSIMLALLAGLGAYAVGWVQGWNDALKVCVHPW